MRKILLATTALVALAGAAQAAESPIQVTLGGSVNFRAALFHESDKDSALNAGAGVTTGRRGGDFSTIYELTVAAEAKAANGIQYGAVMNFDNDPSRDATEATMDFAHVWISGNFGKVLMGDEKGASSLFVFAPTIGEGQIDAQFTDFTDSLWDRNPTFFSMAEDFTKVTYFTPKVGNENHKVQMGVSYTPNEEQGSTVSRRDAAAGYKHVVEISGQYKGTFDPVSVVLAPIAIIGDGEGDKFVAGDRDYTAWGIGAQAMYAGFTLGGSYVDAGHKDTSVGQEKNQNAWTLGLKYMFDNVGLAASYLGGEGYSTNLATQTYIDDFSTFGLGATYTWFPGMVTAADAIFFDQHREDTGRNNIGHVFTLSQKMTF